jgi:hypothetical protein
MTGRRDGHEIMKAISLWQPWASAMAVGAKTIETRHWSTNHRGPLAIHAAKRLNKTELIYLNCTSAWQGVFATMQSANPVNKPLWELLPFGAIVAVGDLTDCRPTESFSNGELDAERFSGTDATFIHPWTERQMGNYALGRFGWVFENLVALPEPIPYIGRQGFFDVPDSLIGEAIAVRCNKCGASLTDDAQRRTRFGPTADPARR